jgi:hypothetical protein
MNNNFQDNRHPAQKPSGPNGYLQICLVTGVPLALHFADGEVIEECVLVQFDSLNLLVKIVSSQQEMIVTRSSLKKIVTTAENNYKRSNNK